MGFPSKIDDLPLIKILLATGLDDYPFSEERRLFYVALTRSKKQTILLTTENNKSIFVNELYQDYKNLMKTNSELKRNIYKCPLCGGRLVPRSGQYGKFMGLNKDKIIEQNEIKIESKQKEINRLNTEIKKLKSDKTIKEKDETINFQNTIIKSLRNELTELKENIDTIINSVKNVAIDLYKALKRTLGFDV